MTVNDAGTVVLAAALTAQPATARQVPRDDGDANQARSGARVPLRDGSQSVGIVVVGSYGRDVVQVEPGAPARLVFDRQDDSACSERMLIPDLGIDVGLTPFGRTILELPAMEGGIFDLLCPMGMLHGRILVWEDSEPTDPNDAARKRTTERSRT